MQFGELSSSGSPTNAVTLTNTSGTFSASTGTVQSATNATVALNGGSADFTFGAALSDNTGQALSIQNKTGGTNDFNGPITGAHRRAADQRRHDALRRRADALDQRERRVRRKQRRNARGHRSERGGTLPTTGS